MDEDISSVSTVAKGGEGRAPTGTKGKCRGQVGCCHPSCPVNLTAVLQENYEFEFVGGCISIATKLPGSGPALDRAAAQEENSATTVAAKAATRKRDTGQQQAATVKSPLHSNCSLPGPGSGGREHEEQNQAMHLATSSATPTHMGEELDRSPTLNCG